MKNLILTFCLFLAGTTFAQRHYVATFEAPQLPKADTFYNGQDLKGGFDASVPFWFYNSYDTTYKFWGGFSISNIQDTLTPGLVNQYASYAGGGVHATKQYLVGYNNSYMKIDNPMEVSGVYVTNNTYAALSMRDGDQFAKQFSAVDKDYFYLTAYGYNAGQLTDSTQVYLADFTSSNPAEHYIQKHWKWFSLRALGEVDSIRFTLYSSDVSQYGINTPGYFCLDNFNMPDDLGWKDIYPMGKMEYLTQSDTFDNGADQAGGFVYGNGYFFPNYYNSDYNYWSGWSVSNIYDDQTPGLANQYGCYAAPDDEESEFLVLTGNSSLYLSNTDELKSNKTAVPDFFVEITNSTYSALSMRDGDQFAKKFGGQDGNDPDYFGVNVHLISNIGDTIDSRKVYLADYRKDDNTQDTILKGWANFHFRIYDVHKIDSIARIDFEFFSSDAGQYGINTPQYAVVKILGFDWFGNVETKQNLDVKFYPNPTSNFIHFKEKYEEVVITDINGRTVLTQTLTNSNKIDVSTFASGMYVLQVKKGSAIGRAKFIVK